VVETVLPLLQVADGAGVGKKKLTALVRFARISATPEPLTLRSAHSGRLRDLPTRSADRAAAVA
jgi:hypothetical protein